MNTIAPLVIFSLGILSAACEAAAPSAEVEFLIRVEASADNEAPLGGVSIALRDEPPAVTDSSGSLLLRTSAEEGALVSVQVACPDGFLPGDSKELRLSSYRSADGGEAMAVPLVVRCQRKEKQVLLAVRASEKRRFQVEALGQQLGSTNADAVGHFVLSVPYDSKKLEVKISREPGSPLPNSSQIRIVDLDRGDTLSLVEAAFPKPRRAKRPSAPSPARHIPYAID